MCFHCVSMCSCFACFSDPGSVSVDLCVSSDFACLSVILRNFQCLSVILQDFNAV